MSVCVSVFGPVAVVVVFVIVEVFVAVSVRRKNTC